MRRGVEDAITGADSGHPFLSEVQRVARRRTLRLRRVAARADRLVRLGRFAEADALLRAALADDPGNLALARRYAISAHNGGRYPDAFQRWEVVRRLDHEDAQAWCGMASNAREQGKIALCSTIIDEALTRFPDDINVIGEAGRIAIRRGDHPAALGFWQRACAFAEVHPDWLVYLVQTHLYLRRFEEAASVLEGSRQRYPDHPGLTAMEGLLAMAREDWDAALRVWEAYRVRWPDDQTGWEQQGRTIVLKDLAAIDGAEVAGPAAAAPVAVARIEDEALRDLLLGFESMGDDCEFGMVQRRYGAEPLGLLRWTGTTPGALVQALDRRFAGIGDPVRTKLLDRLGYYSTADAEFGFVTHTFVPVGEADRDVFLPKMRRRLAFLRDKFVADLANGEKCFVLKSDAITIDEFNRIFEAMRGYGPCHLVLVCTAANAAGFRGEPGELRALRNGLFVGFLSAFGAAKGYWDIAFGEWISICRAVAQTRIAA